MPLLTRNSFLVLSLLVSCLSFAQNVPKDSTDVIHILYADHAITHKDYPGKQLLSGEVQIEHNGALLFCDKAVVDKNENTAIAVGNVRLKQGDTINMQAGYIKYDGKRSFAKAFDKVALTDPKMRLTTDTLYFDRVKQEAYYTSGGFIKDSVNTLRSIVGRYFLNEKRFRFTNNVHITNPDYQIDSYQLDYMTETGISNFFGPTKIYNEKSYIYAEKGHYDSQKKISWFVKNAFIKHKNTSIKGDSLYYDQNREYATGNNHVVVHDSVNKTWIFTDDARRWINLDSVVVNKNPLIVSISEKDTLFMRAQKIITAGKEGNRKLWGFPKVKFYNKDFSGRADSVFRDDRSKIMKLLINPVLWSDKSQITGTKILLKNDSLNHIDSLLIPNDVFIIQKDSLGFNQIKGKKLLGKFEDKQMKNINIYGNTEVIYYLREDTGELTGIEKNKSSRIYIEFEKGEIESIKLFTKPEGIVYPANKFPNKEQKLKGFKWLEKVQIKTKEDVIGDKQLQYEAETKQKDIEKVPEKEKLSISE